MRHIKIEITVGIPDCDYVDIDDLNGYIQEDFVNWFDSCFYDGDSEGRVKLLGVDTVSDYELDHIIEEFEEWGDANIVGLDNTIE